MGTSRLVSAMEYMSTVQLPLSGPDAAACRLPDASCDVPAVQPATTSESAASAAPLASRVRAMLDSVEMPSTLLSAC